MDKLILIRYGEIHLKGKNRRFFENALIKNINDNIKAYQHVFERAPARYIVSGYKPADENAIIDALTKTFGIHSISIAYECDSDIDKIAELAVSLSRDDGTFRVTTNRADKTFPLNSMQISREIGGRILEKKHSLTVDLFNPDFTVYIDLRENGKTFVYSETILCPDGMPVGCAGKGLAMLSGGIDSPVACYSMAKRGLKLDMLHFHSYPYTSEMAKEKVRHLAEILRPYTGPVTLLCAPMTKIQELIHEKCDTSYMITLVRVFMMRIAEKVALQRKCGCIINGESLGQVASQTLESITVTNSQIKCLPVFRPLIGSNKEEIIEISKKIGTYETSIQPYEDCCTVFLPDDPITRPKLKNVERELKKLGDVDALIEDSVNNLEVIEII